MRVIDPGHTYALTWLDIGNGEMEATEGILEFVKREGEGYPGNMGKHPGTNTQDILRVLIDRTQYLDRQIHHDRNLQVLYHLRSTIFELEARAAERHGRPFPYPIDGIERLPVCVKCGHIGCQGECHE